jgi:hypothetical protein
MVVETEGYELLITTRKDHKQLAAKPNDRPLRARGVLATIHRLFNIIST